MAKAVSSSLNGAGAVWGTYASAGDAADRTVPVTVTFTPDPRNSRPNQNT